jgi:hypothetical protein
MSNVWALDLNIEFHKTIKQQWLFGTDGVQPTRVADLPSLRDSNSPNQTKGRRMRAAMAMETEVPLRLQNTDYGSRAEPCQCLSR